MPRTYLYAPSARYVFSTEKCDGNSIFQWIFKLQMPYADHQPLRLPDGFKLYYYQRQEGWAVVLECYDPDLYGIIRVSPPHVRTIERLKDWIEEHWEDLEEVLNLSQCNRALMHCVVKDLRTGNL